ncbi:hypothetical protein H6P81_018710 [Aristolochia fimbriata]|uniref:Uncharacterized protein n=1 Tax=Aristolochia fimbriata TaxID=158543 RepID=A0AAV7E4T8_ARIFI|nr:hypothetical protein H6P81_018710 [Aristolochia fimbriata]
MGISVRDRQQVRESEYPKIPYLSVETLQRIERAQAIKTEIERGLRRLPEARAEESASSTLPLFQNREEFFESFD